MYAKYDMGYQNQFTFKGTQAESVATLSSFPPYRYLPLNWGCVGWLSRFLNMHPLLTLNMV